MEDLLYDSESAISARKATNKYKRLIEFEEVRGDRDLIGVIDYTLKFGQMHLINPTHSLSFIEINDADIKFALLVLGFVLLHVIEKITESPKKPKKTKA